MKTSHQSNTATHYIGGNWIRGEGEAFCSKNPADGSIIWQGNHANTEEVLAACEAAHLALPGWSSIDVSARAAYLQNFAKEVETKQQELTYLIALETGKPLWEAKTEVASVVAKINLSIQAYQERTAGKQFTIPDANAHLRFKPHGVVAVLGAFNFPAHLSNGHIVPALIAGNTVIYKPSELAPAVAQFIMQCWHESGLPQGVINCIQGGIDTSRALLHTDIQGVFFTGSYKAGKQIHQHFSGRPDVILALEMGGNNPLVIDKIKNVDAAVYQTLLSTMITSGQRCTCARRLFIPNDAAGDKFLSRFVRACKQLTVGPFTHHPEPFMGPVISYDHALNHLKAQENLINLGGKPLLNMFLMEENTGLLSPGIIDMTGVSDVPDEEIFAPISQIYRYSTFEEALLFANQTRYGLSAGLLSDNEKNYQQFYHTIRAGLINWNRPTTGAASSLPFGGVGCSGNHRPSAYFAADYCAYPIASLEQTQLTTPAQLLPGIQLD
ncbi:succinylglutamate-semialdehyde dehydrogenase [Legionella hackeliae]|uniref:N-succinylglutamate 5-semialdehyde dehydrogenase n=1 Tax=Legionella hackeliae TaxID=449 RepID=A0A0A8UTR6_LEGHA|nr:succinylglutamate-semialdehyde dehydrogenase [Legionella hackeliae]KTD13792.1 succinylglutamic-5-semialdehyde dehydrogenase [Legionella hackeliae]CEK10492.1 N-succinylglutamate 5-semialdehyde dehydrogenase [Legionella hackeliae]STX47230.1 succinylglutamic-5-semialdehyde dehydrogenase [Legionella hackeliae]